MRQTRPVTVGPTDLRCSVCKGWKPDEEFFVNRTPKNVSRRARSTECKACGAARRRIDRARRNAERDNAGAVMCMRSFCTSVATSSLTNGRFLREIPLSPAGWAALENGEEAQVCDACHALATGRLRMAVA